jgi:hypothetical protein
MWTPQSTARARHWIQRIKIIIVFGRHRSPFSICLEENNRRVDLNKTNSNKQSDAPEIAYQI